VKGKQARRMKRTAYEKALNRLQAELCHLQRWVKEKSLRVIIIFEGRDGAGKGGTIRVLTERLSPRVFRVIALPAPSDRETSQFKKTDTRFAPWYIVRSDDKRAARLNTLRHVLAAIPYKRLRSPQVELSTRAQKNAYNDRKSIAKRRFVEEYY
jgi:polyphosphate kinase 2 (PPK2 family)